MLKEILAKKEYLPILQMNDGTPVTKENWEERRAEMRALLEKYSYGHTPDIPVKVTSSVLKSNPNAYAGKVDYTQISIRLETKHGVFEYPVEFFVPKKDKKVPLFLHLCFKNVPDRYTPMEEVTDAGYAVAMLTYLDVVNDKLHGNFSDGIAAYFGTTAEREPEEWGKIGMWAYGASRVMDYIIAEREDIDHDRIAVVGHSRLGKTALWCGAQDKRFAAVISNNSGYGGAASSKHGIGERVTDFLRCGSWDWYCENFKQFAGDMEDKKPYDQSFLLALIAPRLLCVGSATEDKGADPYSEFTTSLHASAAWKLLGEDGLICPDRLPEAGDHFAAGKIGYHLRAGRHYFSRWDWGKYIAFLNSHWGNP